VEILVSSSGYFPGRPLLKNPGFTQAGTRSQEAFFPQRNFLLPLNWARGTQIFTRVLEFPPHIFSEIGAPLIRGLPKSLGNVYRPNPPRVKILKRPI